MSVTTTIAWCDATWSPWIGCSPVHVGCENCYAAAQAGRFGVVWGQHGTRRKTSKSYWKKPLAWNRKAAKSGTTFRVFPSLCDVFESLPLQEFAEFADLRRDFFALIDKTSNLTWILATKRPENIRKMWSPRLHVPILRRAHLVEVCESPEFHEFNGDGVCYNCGYHKTELVSWHPRPNVHLLYSASNQQTLEAGLPHLLACRDLVPVIGLSLEPLLGPVTFRITRRDGWKVDHLRGEYAYEHDGGYECPSGTEYLQGPAIDWVVVGGESGPHSRPCKVEWIRSIVQQCREAEVPCFVKQDAGRKPGQQGRIPDELWRAKDLP